jgi:membrane fusion protein (multidrug efflux system)
MFMEKKFLVYIAVIAVSLCLHDNALAKQAPKIPPTVVAITKAKTITWQESILETGSLSAFDGTILAPEVSGRVTNIHFASGQYVRQGDLLIEIYPDIIRAQLQRDQAQLRKSSLDYDRNLKLYKKGFVDQSTLDQKRADRDSDQANVNNDQAQLRQHLIQAPFSGLLGLRKVSIGDYVSPGQDLVSLQALDPIRVDFSVPQRYLQQLKLGDTVTISSNALPQNYTGTIYAFDSKVDDKTRMIDMRAKIPNPEHKLLPGTFVEVNVHYGSPQNVLVIPATAVVYSAEGNYVYLMQNNKAVKTNVTVGQKLENNQIIIKKGLKVGDPVISEGQIKIPFDGAPVITEQQYQQMANSKAK